MTDLLARAGISAEAVDSAYRCIARYVEAPATVIVIGLGGLTLSELELVRTLKKEESPPQVLVCFHAALRDMAQKALEMGADGYIPEPFYAQEFVQLVRAHLGASAPRPAEIDWRQAAREIAHAVNNPLQVVSLLLAEEKKKKLVDSIGEQLSRIREVIGHLESYGSVEAKQARLLDIAPILAAAAAGPYRNVRYRVEGASLPPLFADEAALGAALRALFRAVDARAAPGTELGILLRVDEGSAAITIETGKELLRGEERPRLLGSLFTVSPDRDVLPAFALPRALLEAMRGSLEITASGAVVRFVARLSR